MTVYLPVIPGSVSYPDPELFKKTKTFYHWEKHNRTKGYAMLNDMWWSTCNGIFCKSTFMLWRNVPISARVHSVHTKPGRE